MEACFNSRALSLVTGDTEDMLVLTPSHFLICEPLVTVPDQNYELTYIGSLRRWQYTLRMLQDLWRRWSQQYLTKFYHRYGWASQNPQPKLGDIVVVKEYDLPPSMWLIGRAVDLHPGADSIIRVVTLKIKERFLKRPVTKLCLLPVESTN